MAQSETSIDCTPTKYSINFSTVHYLEVLIPTSSFSKEPPIILKEYALNELTHNFNEFVVDEKFEGLVHDVILYGDSNFSPTRNYSKICSLVYLIGSQKVIPGSLIQFLKI